ncbi:DNA polymerase III subunit beta [Nitrospirillum sp. BR 11828]|uniref:nucleotidyltransferase family protein n=1 Tax=Nitrospirillum sp. BR 11828 TaxID=3104325 RepID=UPI002ACA42B6|nr:DNA polymerase III subunit beta [Nitrospirillum sp. BR 11828]MDZ5646871.1 DNA polymerase III subunit beta [Nitrospirillum sp. BR 11828]
MNQEQAVSKLRAHEAELHRAGVAHLFLVGDPTAPGREGGVDLFLDTHDPRFSLIELADIQDKVRAILGRASAVTTRDGLHPRLRPVIEADAVRVF